MKVIFAVTFLLMLLCYYLPSPPPLFKRNLCYKTCPFNKKSVNPICDKIESVPHYLFQIMFLSMFLITFLWVNLINLVGQVRYISFNTNLNLYKKNLSKSHALGIFTSYHLSCLGCYMSLGKIQLYSLHV